MAARPNAILDAYEKLEKLGEGTYGKVYRAREKSTGKIVALKKTIMEDYEEDGISMSTLREVSLLRMLSKDPHIVKLLDAKRVQNKRGGTAIYLVVEYMDTNLDTFIYDFYKRGLKLPSHIVKSLMYQLCKGVAACHSRGVLHRDLKPDNLLLDRKTMTLKIADLGLSRAFTLPMTSYSPELLTPGFAAPELLLGETCYTTAVDIWSVGCIFAQMVTTEALIPGESEMEQIVQIFQLLGTPNERVWPGVSQLMKSWKRKLSRQSPMALSEVVRGLDREGLKLLSEMLRYDPAKRISAKKALEHPYFDGLDKCRH